MNLLSKFRFLLGKFKQHKVELGHLLIIRSSGLFDKSWYLAQNPDAAQAKVNPLLHYLRYGGFEGRDPGPDFSSSWYLLTYEDVQKAGLNPLAHYIMYGQAEGRQPLPPKTEMIYSHSVHQRSSSLPHFMIIGAQKAGTTALYSYLSNHPGIIATKEKEHHFFNCEKNYSKGVFYYKNIFSQISNDQLTFDASPGYLVDQKSARRIYDYNPNIKMIVLLRNPIERAYSAWQMYKKRYENNREWFYTDWVSFCDNEAFNYKRRDDKCIFNFSSFIEEEIVCLQKKILVEASVVNHGFYAQQLNRYFELFGKEQILIIHNDDLRLQTRNVLKSIEDFCGLKHHEYSLEKLMPVFEGGYTEIIEETVRARLSDYYKPFNELLFGLLGTRYKW